MGFCRYKWMEHVRVILVHICSLGFPFFFFFFSPFRKKKNTCIVLKNPSKIFNDKGDSIEINKYKLDT